MTDEQLWQLLTSTLTRMVESVYAGHPQPDWAKAIEADVITEAAYRVEQQGRFRAKAHAWFSR